MKIIRGKRGGRFVAVMLLVVSMLVELVAQPMTAYAATKDTYYIKINRQQNCVTVYAKDEKGKYTVPVKAFACSVGLYGATPKGTFKLGEKYRWHELYGSVYGQYCSRITDHVLFHSVYYSTTDPNTLSYNAYNQLGNTASHGCVRLCVADAKWIYDNCASGTMIEIYDSKNPGPLGKPATIKISSSSKYRGWDPTDPDPKNPWPKTAPKLTGVKNKTIERGAAASKLTSGVKATDFAGNSLKVTVSGNYNLNKVGKYKITYKAVDALGKSTKKKVTITVKDTKAPTISLSKKKVELTDETWEFGDITELRAYLKKLVTAKDSGKKLSAKYVHLLGLQSLWDAWEISEYGDYIVEVYAEDAAGNKSKVKKITVKYVNPDAEKPDETNPSDEAEPTEPTDETNPTDQTDSTIPTDSADSIDPAN